jgi:2-polyprenyl-3-methyl-5-hydroxy-6-metoxy-1,4-benzoquinol methylase
MSMQTPSVLSIDSPRIEKMLGRFLIPMLSHDQHILSVGCGSRNDVMALRRLGFNACGVDPAQLSLDAIASAYRLLLHVATLEYYAASTTDTYDFIYALDIIEHVGCVRFGTILESDTVVQRRRFLSARIHLPKHRGVVLITTSNRLCPLDLGHWHKYHWLGR